MTTPYGKETPAIGKNTLLLKVNMVFQPKDIPSAMYQYVTLKPKTKALWALATNCSRNCRTGFKHVKVICGLTV